MNLLKPLLPHNIRHPSPLFNRVISRIQWSGGLKHQTPKLKLSMELFKLWEEVRKILRVTYPVATTVMTTNSTAVNLTGGTVDFFKKSVAGLGSGTFYLFYTGNITFSMISDTTTFTVATSGTGYANAGSNTLSFFVTAGSATTASILFNYTGTCNSWKRLKMLSYLLTFTLSNVVKLQSSWSQHLLFH